MKSKINSIWQGRLLISTAKDFNVLYISTAKDFSQHNTLAVKDFNTQKKVHLMFNIKCT